MLDSIIEAVRGFLELWPYMLPIIPYLGTMLIIGKVMNKVVKPAISAHRRGKRGEFHNQYWALAHKYMMFIPMLMGAACGGLCIATGIGGHILAYVLCGAAAQYAHSEYLHWSEKRGVINK